MIPVRASPSRRLAVLALLAGAALCSGTATAQTAFTGREFAGVRLPQTPVTGRLAFAAQRAWAWRVGETRRLVLSGDVRVTIAQHTFIAKRAAAWMLPISEPGQPETFQIFIVFDQLGDPGQPAAGGLAAARLPVRAVLSVVGKVELTCDSVTPTELSKTDPEFAFVTESEALFASSLARMTGAVPPTAAAPLPPLPTVSPRRPAPVATAVPGPAATQPPPPGSIEAQAVSNLAEPTPDAIFVTDGIITIGAKDITVVSGTDENSVIATDGVVIMYQDLKAGRTLQLTAQRAVVFTDPGELRDMARFSVEQVRGIFLEGDVTGNDGRFTIRGPQIYYDVRNNKAVMLDAVFWTYDEQRKLPLFVRAKTVHQTAADQFTAEKAVFTNSAFFEPELSLGASTVTISRKSVPVVAQSPLDADKPQATESSTTIVAEDITLRAAGVPFFYWPTYSGDPSRVPLKDLRVENRNGNGVALRATWDAYSLLGLKKPGDFRFDLMTDVYFERGAGLGTRLGWNDGQSKGGIFGYMLPYDTGTDVLQPGTKLDHDGDFRGMITAEQRWKIDEKWSIFAEGSYISDPTFVTTFFPDLSQARREFTNRLRADRVDANTALSLDASGTFNDFISNEWLLQTPGYSVTRVPEAIYSRQADDLLKDSHPGLISYWSEYRAGALQMAFDEIEANKRGFDTDALAQRAFGFNADQSYGEVLRAAGLTEDTVLRADTRQEISLNTNAGPVKLTPFVVGRVTAWDNDFSEYSPDQNDNVRLWGSVGLRAATTMQRVYDDVDSSLFDVHRLRHVIVPSVTVWYGATTIDSSDLPVYDETVESLSNGFMTRVGATQVLQTQRGGPGRWHSVDLLTVTTDFVFASGDSNNRTPIGRFFDFRPEYSNPGNFFVGDLVYRVTDATALTGSTVIDIDDGEQEYGSAGVIVRHSPQFATSADVRYVNALESTYLNFGVEYDFTNKYSAFGGASYDFEQGGFQSSYIEVRRSFSSMLLGVAIGYNDITGETSFGFIFRPYGAAGAARFGTGGGGTSEFSSGG